MDFAYCRILLYHMTSLRPVCILGFMLATDSSQKFSRKERLAIWAGKSRVYLAQMLMKLAKTRLIAIDECQLLVPARHRSGARGSRIQPGFEACCTNLKFYAEFWGLGFRGCDTPKAFSLKFNNATVSSCLLVCPPAHRQNFVSLAQRTDSLYMGWTTLVILFHLIIKQ